MKLGLNIFTRVMMVLLFLSLMPVTISSLLVVGVYDDIIRDMARALGIADPTAYQRAVDLTGDAFALVTMILLITVIVTIFTGLSLSRSISLPIRRLLYAFGRVAKADLEIRLPVRTNDEFGELGRGFNAMVRKMSESAQELERTNASLEHRVAERTAELSLAYERLKRGTEQINEANRLKSEFVANMSHELRTPLVAIQGYSDLALDGVYGPLPEKLEAALNKIRTNSKQLQRLITDVLDLSKIEAGRLEVYAEDFDLMDLTNSTAEDLRPLYDKKHLTLSVRADGPIPRLHQDGGKIGQILLNLLSNALKFTETGSVSVNVSHESDQDEVLIEVIDTGIGIPPEQREAVFDPFRQLDGGMTRSQGGTGLGLALVRQLAELMGGEVGVASHAGSGSRFWVRLPVRYDPAHDVQDLMRKSRPLVLAIDDDSRALGDLASFLEGAGYAVSRCSEAHQGLERARELRPHAILVDELMPGLDGWAYLKQLRADPMTRAIPVIMMGDGVHAKTALDSGADDYWKRPIPRADRLARLQHIIARSTGRREDRQDDSDPPTDYAG